MTSRPPSSNITILHQISKLIPARLVDDLAKKHGLDRQARSFSPWSHTLALLYTQLTHAFSLNDVCDSLGAHPAHLAAIRGATPPRRNTLSHANRTRSPAFAQDLFWGVMEHLSRAIPGFGGRNYGGLPRRFKRNIFIVDATVIRLVANCLDWASHRRRKAAAKLHLRLDLQSFLPDFAVIDVARQHDNKRARELCAGLRPGEIVVFDKAYIDFAHLADLDGRGVFWVTRAKDNMSFRKTSAINEQDGGLFADDEIELVGEGSPEKYSGHLRRIVMMVEVDGKNVPMTFITNNMVWAPSSISDLYKSRWGIEAFFKQMKQTLQLADFLGHNRNAILWQTWTALLLLVLLRALAFANRWGHSFQRLFCLLRGMLWERLELPGLLAWCGTAGGLTRDRGAPEQAYLPGFEP